jgi:predicted Zn-dependent protease
MTARVTLHHQLSAADEQRLLQLNDLYDRGLYLQAYEAGRAWGDVQQWPEPGGLVMGSRLAYHLGCVRLSDWLIRRAFRNSPHDGEARYFYAYAVLRRFGPYRAWRWMHDHSELPESMSPDLRSSWFALQGEVAAMLRDFTAAEKLLARAREISPDSAWIRVCATYILEAQDRYDEALEEAQKGLALRPHYRPAVQAAAHLFSLLDRDEDAIALLQAAEGRQESAAIAAHLFGYLMELKQYPAADKMLARYVSLSPLLEKKQHKWLAAQRAEVAYYLGDYDAAIEQAEQSNSEFHKAVAERLRDPVNRAAPAIILPVGFVRQHRATCAPATLSAISRFWSMPADHLQVADEICYDGTSNYNERKWATDHGWHTREFSVTEESARALIERGVPFTFTTVDPASAHLQAIIGYDGRRGTVLVRDPFWRSSGEAFATKLFDRYRAYGPRGMVLVPQEHAEKLAGIDLPDVALWDLLHQLDRALNTHQRDAAETIATELEQAAPNHRLALEARRRLAMYDGNFARQLAVIEQLIEQFPDNPNMQLERLQLQQMQSKRADRLEICEKLCAKADCHPIFWQHLAEELQGDARRREDARRLLKKGIRRWPTEASNYQLLANILWDERRYEEALELYRFAACLADKDERLAGTYFTAARWQKQTGEVLHLLEDRFQRFGQKSPLPARTLTRAYLDLDREEDALATVEAAVKMRPDDGPLLLHAADTYLQAGHQHAARAAELIEQAKGNSPPARWRRARARLSQLMGDFPEALTHWQAVVALQPLAVDAHRSVTQLLAQTAGRAASLAYLQQVIDQNPHCYALFELWIEWLRDEPGAVREQAIHRALELNADDAWLHRELAFLLIEGRRSGEAEKHADLACKLEPQNPSSLYLRAMLYRETGKLDEARAALRQTIEASIDAEFAIAALIELCTTLTERRQVLQFVQEQLVKQVTFGEGLLAYRNYASETLPAEEVLQLLQNALAARPDLWTAWSANIRQLLFMDQHDQAWPLVEQATQKFPLTPRLWFDRALVARARLANDAEVESLQNALRINPSWGVAARALADFQERHGDKQAARQTLERVIARDPLDVVTACKLAELEWELGEKAAALDRYEKAALLEPGYEPAWEGLANGSRMLGCAERSEAAVKGLTEQRPGEARSWLRLAQSLDPALVDERLAAWDRALELNPRCESALDEKAVVLAQNERWEEALAACNPPAFNGQPPVELRLRQGWIEAERGNLPEAIRLVEAIVAEEPHVYSAWVRLADWYQDLGEKEKYLRVAEAMVRLNPQYEISLGYLGEARLMNGDEAGAKEVLTRAFELNPSYDFAGISLFDLQLAANELNSAAKTMATLRMHHDNALISARQVQLAAKQNDEAAACAALPAICQAEDGNRWPLKTAVAAMKEAGWAAQARGIITQHLAPAADTPPAACNADLGVRWIELATDAGDFTHCATNLRNLVRRGEIGERAVYAYIDAAARKQQNDAFLAFWRANREWLATNTYCWGSAAYGLSAMREWKEVAAWCAPWRDQKDVQPWMLVNAIEGFRAVGNDAEANAVADWALAQPPSFGQHLMKIWKAADAVIAGDFAAAADWLEQVGDDELDIDYGFLMQLVKIAIAQHQAGPGNTSAFRSATKQLADLKAGYQNYAWEPARRTAYRRIVQRIAATRGGLWAWLWSLVTRANSFPAFQLY